MIEQLQSIQTALGQLEVTSTRRNLEIILGSMQMIDKLVEAIRIEEARKREEGVTESG